MIKSSMFKKVKGLPYHLWLVHDERVAVGQYQEVRHPAHLCPIHGYLAIILFWNE